MNFLEYMQQKVVRDRYNAAIEPFMQKIQILTTKRDEELKNIERKYSILINQEKLAMQESCDIKLSECKHDIPVVMSIRGSYGDHDDTQKVCYCLTCGESLDPNHLNTLYIYLKKDIDKSEVLPILNALRSKIDELWQENPNMSMLDVKCALEIFVNVDLTQTQRRG